MKLNDSIEIILGDCIEVMRGFEENTFDTLVTDPPAGISMMGKKWDNMKDYTTDTERGSLVAKSIAPLLGILQPWEAGFLLFTVDWAFTALRVLKPGASGLVWALPRTSDLTQFGLRLAGFEVVDVIDHVFGVGFPKSYNVAKGLQKAIEDAIEEQGYEFTEWIDE